VPGSRYRSRDRMPLVTMEFDHRAEPHGDGTRITYVRSISGPLGPVFARLFGKRMADTLPEVTEALAARAEQL
jgi:hypothetical protein